MFNLIYLKFNVKKHIKDKSLLLFERILSWCLRISEQDTSVKYEYEILQCIKNNPGGVTITDVSDIKGYSRNTVSKYINILKLKNKIYKKKVGAYSLYFSSEENYLPNSLVLSYYKVLLKGLKNNLPEKGEFFKELIKENASDIKFTFSPKIYKQLKYLKNHPISQFTKIHLEIFKEFYPTYDIFQPDVNISVLNIDPKGKKATYRFRNSVFLKDNNNYIYHLYFMCGLTEGILEKEIKQKVKCKVENYHIGGDKKDSYFDISITID